MKWCYVVSDAVLFCACALNSCLCLTITFCFWMFVGFDLLHSCHRLSAVLNMSSMPGGDVMIHGFEHAFRKLSCILHTSA